MNIHEATWEEIARHNINFVKQNYGEIPLVLPEEELYEPVKSGIPELPQKLGGIPTRIGVSISAYNGGEQQLINYRTRIDWSDEHQDFTDEIKFGSTAVLSPRSDIRTINGFIIVSDITEFINVHPTSSNEMTLFYEVEEPEMTEKPHYRGPSGLVLASLLEVFAITTNFEK